jgi:hypothetical protein
MTADKIRESFNAITVLSKRGGDRPPHNSLLSLYTVVWIFRNDSATGKW